MLLCRTREILAGGCILNAPFCDLGICVLSLVCLQACVLSKHALAGCRTKSGEVQEAGIKGSAVSALCTHTTLYS